MTDDLIARLRRAKLRHEHGYMRDVGYLLTEASVALETAKKVCDEVGNLLEKLETTCTHDSIIIDKCWRLLEEIEGV